MKSRETQTQEQEENMNDETIQHCTEAFNEQFETLLRETKKSYIQGIQLGLSISALIISVIALSMQLLK